MTISDMRIARLPTWFILPSQTSNSGTILLALRSFKWNSFPSKNVQVNVCCQGMGAPQASFTKLAEWYKRCSDFIAIIIMAKDKFWTEVSKRKKKTRHCGDHLSQYMKTNCSIIYYNLFQTNFLPISKPRTKMAANMTPLKGKRKRMTLRFFSKYL